MIEIRNKIAFIAACLMYILTGPFYIWPILKISAVNALISFILSYLFCLNLRKNSAKEKLLIILFICGVLIQSFTAPYSKIFSFVAYLPLFFVLFGRDDFNQRVYYYFEKIFLIFIAAALLCWILVLIGVLPSLGNITGLIDEFSSGYSVYLFCVQRNEFESIKFCGPYDEPGVVGTLCAIMICIRQFDFKKYESIILLIAGIFSLSFFFFVIIGVYGIFYSIINKKLLPLIFLGSVFTVFYMETKDDPLMDMILWRRFEWDSDNNKLAGDNRTDYAVDVFYESKKSSWDYWFGLNQYDWNNYIKMAEGTSSYKNVVLSRGMLFFSLYILFFVCFGFHYKRSNVKFIFYLILFLGTMYQRTNLYDLITMFLFCYLARYNGTYTPLAYKEETI